MLIAEERFAPPPINLIVAEALIELTLSDNVVQANEQIEVQARLVEATELRTPIPNTVVEVSTTIGTFSIATRKARTGINPQTKEKIKSKASKAIKFKGGAGLKAKI